MRPGDNFIQNPRTGNTPAISIALSFVLLLAGLLYCLFYGRIGYMPQDHSAVFDGGWRILSGQIPFRDFALPNAILPIFLQAFIFKLLGINWFVYCLHAALFNGLFCVLVFFFLRMFGGTLKLSFFYALLSGVVFYTPFGIPVQDQHAYCFTFLLIFLACLSVRVSRSWLKQLIFFSLPIVMVGAFLSKQIPTIFGAALVGAIVLVGERRNLIALARSLLAGTLAVSLSLGALYHILGIDFELLKVHFFELPAETGSDRLTWVISGNCVRTIKYMISHWQLFSPFALVTMLFLGVMIWICLRFIIPGPKPRWKAVGQRMEKHLFPLFLAQSFLLICFLFVILTKNQRENGVPLIFVSLGLTHLFLQGVWGQDRYNDPTVRSLGQRSVSFLVSFILVGSSLWCAWNFDRKVNATRMVHDFIYKKEANEGPKQEKPGALSFLVWGVPKSYRGTPEHFLRIVDFFQRNNGNFFLLGDSSILYALTGRPSVNPVLWFHPGETLPLPGSPLFPAFQDRLMEALRKYRIRYIVTEVSRVAPYRSTWSMVNLAYFPALDELVQKKGHELEHFGPFTIIELIMPFGPDPAGNRK
jgi:hypothetical protein